MIGTLQNGTLVLLKDGRKFLAEHDQGATVYGMVCAEKKGDVLKETAILREQIAEVLEVAA